MNTGLNHLRTPNKGIIFLIVALHCMNGFAWPNHTDTHFDHLAAKEVSEVLLIDIGCDAANVQTPRLPGQVQITAMPIPNVWMGIGGDRPGILGIGRIRIRLAPGRVKRPVEESQTSSTEPRTRGVYQLVRVSLISQCMDIPSRGLASALRQSDTPL